MTIKPKPRCRVRGFVEGWALSSKGRCACRLRGANRPRPHNAFPVAEALFDSKNVFSRQRRSRYDSAQPACSQQEARPHVRIGSRASLSGTLIAAASEVTPARVATSSADSDSTSDNVRCSGGCLIETPRHGQHLSTAGATRSLLWR